MFSSLPVDRPVLDCESSGQSYVLFGLTWWHLRKYTWVSCVKRIRKDTHATSSSNTRRASIHLPPLPFVRYARVVGTRPPTSSQRLPSFLDSVLPIPSCTHHPDKIKARKGIGESSSSACSSVEALVGRTLNDVLGQVRNLYAREVRIR